MSKKRLMFICTGNICRSPLAHRLFEKLAQDQGVADHFECESSGTTAYHQGQNADARMRDTAQKNGWQLDHISRALHPQDLQDYDWLIVMDRTHLEHIRRMNPSIMHKVKLFAPYYDPSLDDVPDPYYGGQDGFDQVYAMCLGAAQNLLHALIDDQD